MAMIDSIGKLPTLFLTLSSADIHWKDLREVLECKSKVNCSLFDKDVKEHVLYNRTQELIKL